MLMKCRHPQNPGDFSANWVTITFYLREFRVSLNPTVIVWWSAEWVWNVWC